MPGFMEPICDVNYNLIFDPIKPGPGQHMTHDKIRLKISEPTFFGQTADENN